MASAVAEDDFSFPATTADPLPCFMESPHLWRPTGSAASSHHYSELRFEGNILVEDFDFQKVKFQEFEAKSSDVLKQSSPYDDGDKEEKMDILWEDLNEEFSRSSGKLAQNSDISSPGRNVQISCINALKLSKAKGQHMLFGKKPNILVFVKILKKVFVIHNSRRRSIKKHAR